MAIVCIAPANLQGQDGHIAPSLFSSDKSCQSIEGTSKIDYLHQLVFHLVTTSMFHTKEC